MSAYFSPPGPQSGPQSGKTLSRSMFVVWRCVVSIAHADGVVDPAERAHLAKVFDGLERTYGLTVAQRAVLEADLEAPQDIAALLPLITEPDARAQLVYFGGLLAQADGFVSPEEEDILKKLRAEQVASLDMEAIRASAQKAVIDEAWKATPDRVRARAQSTFGEVIDDLFLALGT